MSFALTTPQFLDGSKDVTRRFGWAFLKPGDILCAVEKGMGLKKGEKVKRLGFIEVVSVRNEPLDEITQDDVRREGFPHWTPRDFTDFFCRSKYGARKRGLRKGINRRLSCSAAAKAENA